MNKSIIIVVIMILVLLGGYLMYYSGEDTESIKNENNESSSGITEKNQIDDITEMFTLADISTHSLKDDCWLLISGKVYDVSEFTASHPGGEAILEGCGSDATLLYETRPMGSGTPHSEKARDGLENYYIGDLK